MDNPFIIPRSDDEILRYFVGRQGELARLHEYYSDGGRLASIHGSRGTGKTMLARVFHMQSADLFPGGAHYLHAHHLMSFDQLLTQAKPNTPKKRELLILDDLNVHGKQQSKFVSVIDHFPNMNLLAISPYDVEVGLPGLSLHLDGLPQSEFETMLALRLGLTDSVRLEQLHSLVDGNPLLAELAANSVREGIISWERMAEAFGEFDAPTILGPDGTPYDGRLYVPEAIVHDVEVVNTDLMARVKASPEAMRSLTPRQFEELVAELLSRLGYSVELTPPSKDGGFDMYAAKRDGVGQFLYLVECKRYTPPNKVGVDVVRSLHGVVQKNNANAGLLVTSSFFTKGTEAFQKELKFQIQLSDFFKVKKWLGMI